MERIDTESEIHSSSIHEELKTRTLYEMAKEWSEQPWDGVQYNRIAQELWDSIDGSGLIEGPYGDSVTLLESCIDDSTEALQAGQLTEDQAVDGLKKLLENDDFIVGAKIIEVYIKTNPVCRISNPTRLHRSGQGLRERPFLTAFGIYIVMATAQWLGYLMGYIQLDRVLFFTQGVPLVLFGIYYIRKTRFQITTGRIVIVVGGGMALGFPIWAFLNYVLYVPIWAPFHGIHSPLNTVAFVLITALSYGGAAYLMDRLGRRRNYQPLA